MATQQGGAEICENLCPTITAAAGMSGNTQPVICLQGNGIDREDTAGCNGKGWKEDTCYTLNTIDRPAVCYDVRFSSEGTKNQRGHCYLTKISRALDTGGGLPDSNHGGICVLQCISLDRSSFNQGVNAKFDIICPCFFLTDGHYNVIIFFEK